MSRSFASANFVFQQHYQQVLDLSRAAEREQKGAFKTTFLEKIDEVKAHEHCHVNLPAGAFYWFTLMTTIGYGNASVMTEGGRVMVYTLGFISILLFTSISAQAGYVSLAIADDFFNYYKLKFLTRGFGASLFWFAVYHLWNLLISSIVLNWSDKRYLAASRPDMSSSDGFWMAYISTTTVGFGDFFFPHEIIFINDMFYVPVCLLIGFIALANFLIKFGEWLGKILMEKNVFVNIVDLKDTLDAKSQSEQISRRATLERLKSTLGFKKGNFDEDPDES